MLTLAFLSHHSNHLISKNIEKIVNYGLNISFLVIENSLDHKLKIELEKKYKNIVKVHIPDENLGFAKGMNKAIELSSDNFVFLSPPDVDLSYDCISDLLKCLNNFKDFTLLAPTYHDESSFKNYDESLFSKDFNQKNSFKIMNRYILREVDWIDSSVIVNKSKIDNLKIMDENFFLYFETMDMCLNFKKNRKKMYIIDNIKFEHLGGVSHEKKFNYEAALSRNWHYNWSKFYYFKKNYSYLYAFKKSLPILFKLSIKYISSLLKSKKEKKHLIKAEINGIATSMLLRKSSYRPFIKKID